MEDLEEAITSHREALTLRPPGHPNRSKSLDNLASCSVHTRYKQLGRMEDLEEVITYHREALTLCPPGHPDRSVPSTTLPVRFILAMISRVDGGSRRGNRIPPRSTRLSVLLATQSFHVPQQPCQCCSCSL
jgi:hypothetical protein